MAAKYADFVAVGPQSPGGRFLRKFWQPVFVSSQLAAGRAGPLRVLDEDFTLYRGESDCIGLVAPRCAHRGLPLSLGRVEGDCLSCLYHGWTYDAEGQCAAQPAEKRSFADSVKLAHYPTREYHRLIFAYFEPRPIPQFPVFAALEQDAIVETRESRRGSRGRAASAPTPSGLWRSHG